VIDQYFLLWNCFQICQLSQRANQCVCSCFLCGDGTFSLTLWVSQVFHSCSALRPYITHFDDIYKDFTTYKTSVPVTGAIILDESYQRCLLVKGWKAGASWSFPRGKKNKDEEDCDCAVREVCFLRCGYRGIKSFVSTIHLFISLLSSSR
jgi:hypothetical protein